MRDAVLSERVSPRSSRSNGNSGEGFAFVSSGTPGFLRIFGLQPRNSRALQREFVVV